MNASIAVYTVRICSTPLLLKASVKISTSSVSSSMIKMLHVVITTSFLLVKELMAPLGGSHYCSCTELYIAVLQKLNLSLKRSHLCFELYLNERLLDSEEVCSFILSLTKAHRYVICKYYIIKVVPYTSTYSFFVVL